VFGVRLKRAGDHVYLEMAAVLEPLLQYSHRLIPKRWFEEKWNLGMLQLDCFRADYCDTNRKLHKILGEFQRGASEFHVAQCEHLRKLLAIPEKLRTRTNLVGTAPLPFVRVAQKTNQAEQANDRVNAEALKRKRDD
jgi:hypothetical protein